MDKTKMKDGIYYITSDGYCIPVELYSEKEMKEMSHKFIDWIEYVGVKLGSKSIAVAKSDATPLCNPILKISPETRINIKTDEGAEKTAGCLSTGIGVDFTSMNEHHVPDIIQASGDWNGKENTENIKQDSGWNEFMSKIKLNKDEYIPSVAELKLIQIFGKQLNEAINKIHGDPLLEDWYFTSTQFSSTGLWDMYFGDGRIACINNFDEKLNAFRPLAGRVRAVHTF